MKIGQRPRIDPDQLLDLCSRLYGSFDIDGVDRGSHREAWFVGGVAFEHAVGARAALIDATTQLLDDFSRHRGDVALTGAQLAAGLHEGRGATLSHQEDAACRVANQRGNDPEDVIVHVLCRSAIHRSQAGLSSRAGDGRTWPMASRRPRGGGFCADMPRD